ncbi:MAG: RdgB/HAM1 family non-canonical purine NTP pyrophosphatase [Bacilli bacterium]
MNFEIIFASSNEHKLKEVRKILSPHGITVYGLNDLNLDFQEANENGTTYVENALIKAEAVAKATSMPIIADDSGLEIKSLDNAPGIYTSRYAKELGGYTNAMNHINELLKNKDKSAKFVCAIVLLNVDKEYKKFIGEAEGEIVEIHENQNGFGYDPCFYSHDLHKVFSLATEDEKNAYSHRGKALKKLITYLKINKLIK